MLNLGAGVAPPGRKVAVLGLGLSGFESALFLQKRGFTPFVSEHADDEAARVRARRLRDHGIEVETGRHSQDRLLQADWILISPGISPKADLFCLLRQKQKAIYSEIEVASWFSPARKVVAVTGTCGKTTVTTLLERLVRRAGKRAISCGNIGTPWIASLEDLGPEDIVILEVSSFQLKTCRTFRPDIGILLNLSPNHLDWHEDMRDYVSSKLNVFAAQRDTDYALFRKADRLKYFPGYAFEGQTVFLDESRDMNPNHYVLSLVAGILGLNPSLADEVIAGFEGIEHRLEIVGEIGGVRYINDSKSTTPSALTWGLDSCEDGKVVLIAGGHPKSDDFEEVAALISSKVKAAVLIGEAGEMLDRAWNRACVCHKADKLEAALEKAAEIALPGDTVLMSPACASFDMFENYEHRGRQFKAWVHERMMAGKKNPETAIGRDIRET